MLGSVVARYFREQGADVRTTDERGPLSLILWASSHDLTVNCIPPASISLAMLPVLLCYNNYRVIQPSTDAINEQTPYAAAKRKGDHPDAVIIRAGLVDLRAQHEIAYTNWLCNPLTPLEWAQVAWTLRDAKPGVYEYGREPLDRYEVSRMVRQLWHLPPPKPARAPEPNNRVLKSRHNFPTLDVALQEYKAWLDQS